MTEIDRELRAAAQAARRAAEAAIDSEADLVATRVRAERPGIAWEPPGRRWLVPVAAAALLVLCAGGLVLLAGRGERSTTDTVAPTLAPTTVGTAAPVLSTSLPEQATSVPVPATSPPDATTTEPAPSSSPAGTVGSTVGPSSTSVAPPPAIADCSGVLGLEPTVQRFVEAMIEVRAGGDPSHLAGCLDAVPAAFTGTVPGCWTPCAGGDLSIVADHLHIGTVGMPDGSEWWTITLPVSHRVGGEYTDVIETWELRPADGGGFRIGDVSIDTPPVERAASLATIAEYLDHIERGEWSAAAEMLAGGGLELEARTDVQQLEPDAYTTAEIAAALERWCRAGCDTTTPTLDELTFSGGFSLIRGGEEIRAGWFEGEYFVIGVPFRR